MNKKLQEIWQLLNSDLRRDYAKKLVEKLMEKPYKIVLDCQDMPDDVRKAFFDSCWKNPGNDCYVDYYIEDELPLVDDWVKQFTDENEVIIKHWW